MIHPDCPAGFRVVGGTHERREVVDAPAAFAAYCAADPKVHPDREAYLSLFRYPQAFVTHMKAHGSPKGYAGTCWSPWLFLDIDRPDLTAALIDARRMTEFLLQRYPSLDDEHVLVFFSGSKGYHVGVPLPHIPAPSSQFPATCRVLAEGLGALAQVPLDLSVYDRVRLFRAPNSRHPKTGLHKRRLAHDELMGLKVDRIRELAAQPLGFDVPDSGGPDDQLVTDWDEAAERAAERVVRASPPGANKLVNRATLDFLRGGAGEGERNHRLYAAAADLAEHGIPARAIHAVLTEAALDTGLRPAEVARTIESAAAHVLNKGGGG